VKRASTTLAACLAVAALAAAGAAAHGGGSGERQDPFTPRGHDHGAPADEHAGHVHGPGPSAEPVERPRAAVLGAFAGLNAAIVLGAAVLRRRDAARRALVAARVESRRRPLPPPLPGSEPR
jgi:hypothetical protein